MSATPSPAAQDLEWDALLNAAYPNEQAAGGVVQLTHGVFHQTQPEGGSIYFQLSHLRIFSDLNGDALEDALVILMVDSGGPDTAYYLNAVLNQGGDPHSAASLRLGEQIFLRSLSAADGIIELVVDGVGEEDYSCCPTDSVKYTYRLAGEQFQQLAVVDLPDPQVGGRPVLPPQRITLTNDTFSTTLTGEIGFNQIDQYLLHLEKDQLMDIEIISPQNDVLLSISGDTNGEIFTSVLDNTSSWAGAAPVSQDYRISALAASEATSYTLSVKITTPAQEAQTGANQESLPTAENERKVIYLTFDDGPTEKWTPQILEVLAGYDALATFFVLGEQARQYPEILEAVLAGGHSVGNHSYSHQSFDGITRQGFRREVENTGILLKGKESFYLRPPYGAVDALTRTYAAEQGYVVVLWDVDSQDWRRPGVTAIVDRVLNEVQPGDIVLFHDGGGDRSQTARALKLILSTLSAEGYTFEALRPSAN